MAEIEGKITLDGTGVGKGAGQAKKGARALESVFSGVSSAISAVVKVATIGFGLIATAAGAGAAGIKGALDLGGELNDLSANTGASVAELAVMRQAFKNSGGEAEELGKHINKMQKAIAEGDEIFEKLGINLDQLRKQSPTQQMLTVAKAISAIDDPATKAAASMGIFGKSGGKMLAILDDLAATGMGDAAKQVGAQAQILDRNAGLFDDVSDKLGLIGTKVSGFFVGVADKVAPVLKPLLDRFAKLDLSRIGQQIGSWAALIVQAFADGKVGKILFLSLKIAFANAINFLFASLLGLGEALWQVLKVAFASAIGIVLTLTKAEFWVGMGAALLGIAARFVGAILIGVAELARRVGLTKIATKLEEAGDAANQDAARMEKVAGSNLGPIIQGADDLFRKMMSSVVEEFRRGYQAAPKLMDGSPDSKTLAALTDGLVKSVAATTAKSQAQTAKAAAKPTPDGEQPDLSKATSSAAALGSRLSKIGGGGGTGASKDPAVILDEMKQLGQKQLEAQMKIHEELKKRDQAPLLGRPVFAAP